MKSPVILLAVLAASTNATNCRELRFNVSATAQNRNLTGTPGDVLGIGLDALVQRFVEAPLITVAGSQTIAATYCTPTVPNGNNNKLQVLYGSITADRGGWSALGGVGTDFPEYRPELYSWVRCANAQGYATLAVDRLGTGVSSRPDPVLVAQAAYEISLYASLANDIRAGTTGQLPRTYQNLIYIGNSYGSQLGTGLAGSFPRAYDTYVLTGFTNSVQKGFVGVSLVPPAPAAVVDPAGFGTLNPGYLTTTSQIGRTNSFFGSPLQVDFENTVGNLFFQRKDVLSVGQLASVYAFPFSGAGFTGQVLTLDGEQDQPFCGLGSPVLGPASCGTQPRDTGALFPNAQYSYKTVDRIGHAVQVHTRSQVLFDVAHRFLAGGSFMGGAPA